MSCSCLFVDCSSFLVSCCVVKHSIFSFSFVACFIFFSSYFYFFIFFFVERGNVRIYDSVIPLSVVTVVIIKIWFMNKMFAVIINVGICMCNVILDLVFFSWTLFYLSWPSFLFWECSLSLPCFFYITLSFLAFFIFTLFFLFWSFYIFTLFLSCLCLLFWPWSFVLTLLLSLPCIFYCYHTDF